MNQSFPLLKQLEKLGNTKAHKIIEEKIIISFQERNIYDIRYIISHRFLNRLPCSRLEELFDEIVQRLIFDPTDKLSFSCLKNLPDFVKKTEETFQFITNALEKKFYAYKSQAAIILIEHFFERDYNLIKNIIKQNPEKINRIIVDVLLNKDCKKSDALLKYIDWSHIRYSNRIFLRLEDKQIGVNKAHRLLLENDFVVVDARKNYTIYEFCSHKAYKDLSVQIDKLNENAIVEFNTIERALIRDAKLVIPSLPILDVNYGLSKKLIVMLHFTRYRKEFIFTNKRYHYYFYRAERTQDLNDVLKKKKAILEDVLKNKTQIISNSSKVPVPNQMNILSFVN